MSIGLLGPLLMDGGRAALSPRDRVVLAALGCCPGEAVSPESLAEAVWGDEQPASWLKVLQGSVMRLRRAMGSDAIEWTGTGYRLTLAGDGSTRLVSSGWSRAGGPWSPSGSRPAPWWRSTRR